jgi:hypothetical protein
VARDYKHRRRPKKKGSSPSAQFYGGLSVGLAIALIVHLYHGGQARRAEMEGPSGARQPATIAPEIVEDSGPEYDFYDILPEFEVVVPGEIPQEPAPAAGEPRKPAAAYYLQAGSFRSFSDADRRKASLALLGITSAIRKVEVKGRLTHRVQIGPIKSPSELQQLQRRLSESGIEYLALKAKEPVT